MYISQSPGVHQKLYTDKDTEKHVYYIYFGLGPLLSSFTNLISTRELLLTPKSIYAHY